MSTSSAPPEWSRAKAPSPSENQPVTPPRPSAVGEGTTVSSSLLHAADSDDRLLKTARNERKGEVSEQVDSVEQRGLSGNTTMSTLSSNLEDEANQRFPSDWSNSSRSSFVDRVTTPKVNATSTYSVTEGDSDEPPEQKRDLRTTEATKSESKPGVDFVAPVDSKAMSGASNPAEKAGTKKPSPMATERQQKMKSSADTEFQETGK